MPTFLPTYLTCAIGSIKATVDPIRWPIFQLSSSGRAGACVVVLHWRVLARYISVVCQNDEGAWVLQCMTQQWVFPKVSTLCSTICTPGDNHHATHTTINKTPVILKSRSQPLPIYFATAAEKPCPSQPSRPPTARVPPKPSIAASPPRRLVSVSQQPPPDPRRLAHRADLHG